MYDDTATPFLALALITFTCTLFGISYVFDDPMPEETPLTSQEKESAYIRAFKNSCSNTLIQDFTRTESGDEIITLKCISDK